MTENTQKISIKERFRGFLPVIVDVETAGFDPHKNALLEVAMMTIKMNDHGFLEPDELFHANIRPFVGSEINQANIDFLGIDPYDESRDLKSEEEALIPMFKAISKKVKLHHCQRAVLVGHNGNFDLSFIKGAAERLKCEKKVPFHPFTAFDTASIALLVLGQSALPKACIAAGIDYDKCNAHGAAYDTELECKLFCEIYNRFTKFCGIPEPVDVQIDYSKEKDKKE
jgi:ribonuclease T